MMRTNEAIPVDAFVDVVSAELARGRHWNAGQRAGQWAMNRLRDVRPDVYARITGRYREDPFYDDGKLDAFWLAVIEFW